MIEEEIRLQEESKREKNWKRWGPYLAERQWGTVREDYSPDGDSWHYFPFEHSSSRCYRWGEDGILGITDRECRLCFALALWNGKDPLLKERLFGLIPGQGNHGEDVKECYFYLDSTPTHSYMKGLYKYPQNPFPYQQLIKENQARSINEPEYELTETGIFDKGRYFDIFIEYAKQDPDDLLIRITAVNRAEEEAELYLIPTLWFRNSWAWGCESEVSVSKPRLYAQKKNRVAVEHETLGNFFFYYDESHVSTPLFTENETNFKKLYGTENKTDYVKDGFEDYIVHQRKESVNPKQSGTKFAPLYHLKFSPREQRILYFRLCNKELELEGLEGSCIQQFDKAKIEADSYWAQKIPQNLSKEEQEVTRQAFAGLLWNKQFYNFVVEEWLRGDPLQPPPPKQRRSGRNNQWPHLYCRDVISIPDKWEYPWFAAWDLAFHLIPFAKIDPQFAKQQILLFLREWYMHPNGQQPAYEYGFSNVNPPVHAWSAWRIYKMTAARGDRDVPFLESAFQKLLLNFTWWVNRKDKEGNNLFSGGFLGLDNIGLFDRSKIATANCYLEQADGTAWMAFYCLTMLSISLELASHNPVYEDMASKFFEHFIFIADAINQFGGSGLWDEEDGFYYDLLKEDGKQLPIRVRSLVGLLPLIAVEILEERHLTQLKGFSKRMRWFLRYRNDLEESISYCGTDPEHRHRMLAIPSKDRLLRILHTLFDENEFLSPFGIRSLSLHYKKNPYRLNIAGEEHSVEYAPAESKTTMFGGNSNWRGPIWFPINYLIIEALERFHHYYGDEVRVRFPSKTGPELNLNQAARAIADRLVSIFLPDPTHRRPCFGNQTIYQDDHWRDLLLFHEYFNPETGAGLGACHQTGWTALVARLLQEKKS